MKSRNERLRNNLSLIANDYSADFSTSATAQLNRSSGTKNATVNTMAPHRDG
jgi:hypothetical protein